MLTYDLKHPFDYAKDTQSGKVKTCIAIEFRRPKGREANKTYALIAAMAPMAEGKIPENLADIMIEFVNKFADLIGDPDFPISEVSENIDGADLLEMAGKCIENFT